MATMTGVVLPGNRHLELREFPVPEPGHGQVLIRMRASSLCGSDLRAIYRPVQQGTGPEAYQGVIAGHEPCGIIEQVGPGVEHFKAGDRVVVYHIAGCGECRDCRAGWMISCSQPQRAAYGWQCLTRLSNPSEAHPKLAIAITDEVLRPHTKGGGFPKRYVQSKGRFTGREGVGCYGRNDLKSSTDCM
jgi:D-arabinose 1-dehydrogenase-like Zn-dependent alcohol dehydrogenase